MQQDAKFPVYIRLYHTLRQDIIAGIYEYGNKMPSKRTLASQHGISVITVQHAMELLCEEGYVQARERSGYFVIYQRQDFQEAWREGISHWKERWSAHPVMHSSATEMLPERIEEKKADTTAAEEKEEAGRNIEERTEEAIISVQKPVQNQSVQPYSEVFPFSVLAKTMRKVLLDHSQDILVRSPNAGLLSFRQEICAYLARSRGIHVDPVQVIVGAGAEYLYSLLAQLFPEEKQVALEQPSYHKIRLVYEAFGKICELLPMSADGIESAALENSSSRLLHVTPFNSFPSGITASISKKHQYLAWADSRNGFLIEDNFDSELTVSRKAEEPVFSMATRDNVIYLNTFSKTIAPSVRVGYMVLPERLLNDFNQRLGFYACTVPVFDQYVLAQLLRSGDYERHINRERRRRRRMNGTGL